MKAILELMAEKAKTYVSFDIKSFKPDESKNNMPWCIGFDALIDTVSVDKEKHPGQICICVDDNGAIYYKWYDGSEYEDFERIFHWIYNALWDGGVEDVKEKDWLKKNWNAARLTKEAVNEAKAIIISQLVNLVKSVNGRFANQRYIVLCEEPAVDSKVRGLRRKLTFDYATRFLFVSDQCLDEKGKVEAETTIPVSTDCPLGNLEAMLEKAAEAVQESMTVDSPAALRERVDNLRNAIVKERGMNVTYCESMDIELFDTIISVLQDDEPEMEEDRKSLLDSLHFFSENNRYLPVTLKNASLGEITAYVIAHEKEILREISNEISNYEKEFNL